MGNNNNKKQWTQGDLDRLKKGELTPEKRELIKKVEEQLQKQKSTKK